MGGIGAYRARALRRRRGPRTGGGAVCSFACDVSASGSLQLLARTARLFCPVPSGARRRSLHGACAASFKGVCVRRPRLTASRRETGTPRLSFRTNVKPCSAAGR